MSYHNHIAIIGRIPFDDEDTCLFYEYMTVDEAIRAFSDEMYEDVEDGESLRKFNFDEAGELGVYINHVLVSETYIGRI